MSGEKNDVIHILSFYCVVFISYINKIIRANKCLHYRKKSQSSEMNDKKDKKASVRPKFQKLAEIFLKILSVKTGHILY